MKKETLEEYSDNYGWRIKTNTFSDPVKANELANSAKQDFTEGAKWQAERMYSEEEVYHILCEHTAFLFAGGKSTLSEWFEQFKKK